MTKETKPENRYEYFDKYRTQAQIQQNHQEIEQAIDAVTGRDMDKRIQQIWERVLEDRGMDENGK